MLVRWCPVVRERHPAPFCEVNADTVHGPLQLFVFVTSAERSETPLDMTDDALLALWCKVHDQCLLPLSYSTICWKIPRA